VLNNENKSCDTSADTWNLDISDIQGEQKVEVEALESSFTDPDVSLDAEQNATCDTTQYQLVQKVSAIHYLK
jgi:hypothetical protein